MSREPEARLREVVLRLSAQVAAARPGGLDAEVERAVAVLAEALAADRGAWVQADAAGDVILEHHVWNALSRHGAAGHVPLPPGGCPWPRGWLAPWADVLPAGRPITIAPAGTEAGLSAEASRHVAERGTVALVIVPVVADDGLLAVFVLEWRSTPPPWLASVLDIVQVAANAVAAGLGAQRAARERDRVSERFRSLAALVPGAVYQMRIEVDGHVWFPFVSDAGSALVGIDAETLRERGSVVFERVHADDLDGLMASIETSRLALSLWQHQFRIVGGSRGVRWLRGQATPHREADGATVWHGVLIDVSDERELAAALSEREGVLRRVTETLRDIVVLTDAAMRIEYVSPSVESVLGYRVDQVLGRQATEFLHAGELDIAAHHLATGFRERDGRTLVHRMVHADGRVRYFETLVHVLEGAAGEGAVFSARDVTDRVAAQRRLEEQVAFNAALVALTNDLLAGAFGSRFYQEVLERSVELVPDAQGGSLVVQGSNGAFRFVAAVGYDLAQLEALHISPEVFAKRARVVERFHTRGLERRLSSADAAVLTTAGRLAEIRTTLSVPIAVAGVPRGFMFLDNFENDDAFDDASHAIAEALTAQVGIAWQRLQLEQDLEDERLRYERLAGHDVLTGLPNRRLFRDRLELALRRADRHGTAVGVLFVDLDGFKGVNDRYGHDAGDQLLTGVAARLAASVRGEDTVARLGGDEFAVVVVDASDQSDAEVVARKVVAALAEPFELRSGSVSIGASVGLALYPHDAERLRLDTLMSAADGAMYVVKERRTSGYERAAAGVAGSVAERKRRVRDEVAGEREA